jgi:hypothetical protein
MHLAMCRGCNITIQLNSNRGTINKMFSVNLKEYYLYVIVIIKEVF